MFEMFSHFCVQVDWVIGEATNINNLALLYEGWTPWVWNNNQQDEWISTQGKVFWFYLRSFDGAPRQVVRGLERRSLGKFLNLGINRDREHAMSIILLLCKTSCSCRFSWYQRNRYHCTGISHILIPMINYF